MTGMLVGLDPGVTRTGVVVAGRRGLEAPAVLEAATFASTGRVFGGRAAFERTVDLAEEICKWLGGAMERHSLLPGKVAIERPIYNRNAASFELQWRLFQQIVATLIAYGIAHQISEVHNSSSKLALTGSGSADKKAMVAASPFEAFQFPDLEDREAVADAYGHLLAYDRGNPIYDVQWTKSACVDGPVAQWRAK